MRGSLTSFVDIQEWAATTLKASQEFEDFCNNIMQKTFTFYSSLPFNQVVEFDKLPTIIFYSEVFTANNQQDDFFRTWTLPIVLQILPDAQSEDVAGVTSWTSIQKIKKIAYKACEILEKESNSCGINDLDIRLLEIEALTITDIDEADDLQAQLFISFGQTATL
jgi:hypothetical protein